MHQLAKICMAGKKATANVVDSCHPTRGRFNGDLCTYLYFSCSTIIATPSYPRKYTITCYCWVSSKAEALKTSTNQQFALVRGQDPSIDPISSTG